MKLRFAVNQAEAMRRGIDAPKSIVTIDVDPAALPQEERDLLADRMEGIDVCALSFSRTRMTSWDGSPRHVVALEPNYDALLEAVKDNQLEIDPSQVLSPRVSKGLLPDPMNPGWVVGWLVYHPESHHLFAVRSSQQEASEMQKKVGREYIVEYGSHRSGSDEFVTGRSEIFA